MQRSGPILGHDQGGPPTRSCGGHDLSGRQAEYCFKGPADGLEYLGIRATQPEHVRRRVRELLASAHGFAIELLGVFAGMNIDAHADIFGKRAIALEQGRGADVDPAILARERPKSGLEIDRLAIGKRRLIGGQQQRAVVGMGVIQSGKTAAGVAEASGEMIAGGPVLVNKSTVAQFPEHRTKAFQKQA